MKELDQKTKNKLLAAADIVENGDMAVLKKLLEFQDILDSITVDVNGNKMPIEEAIKELKSNFEDSIYRVKQEFISSRVEIKDLVDEIATKLDSLTEKSDKTDVLNKIQMLSNEINSVKNDMPCMPDMSYMEEKINQLEESVSKMENEPEDPEEPEETPEEIKNKLESITEEENKLSILAIAHLRSELDELRKNIGKSKGVTIFGGGGGNGGGHIVKAYDLSASLNGVLKTFSLPAFWRVVSVHSSSFPFVFRETTDYTTDGSAMTITFTSEIVASATLATGQTLIVTYAE